MAVCIIFKSSAIRAQFKLHYTNLPMISTFLQKREKKNSKCTVPNYYAQQSLKTFYWL